MYNYIYIYIFIFIYIYTNMYRYMCRHFYSVSKHEWNPNHITESHSYNVGPTTSNCDRTLTARWWPCCVMCDRPQWLTAGSHFPSLRHEAWKWLSFKSGTWVWRGAAAQVIFGSERLLGRVWRALRCAVCLEKLANHFCNCSHFWMA